jgi:tripeptide aminopeptidase
MNPTSTLIDLFIRLARIDGVSLAERRVADEVTALLSGIGVRVVEDDSAAILGGDTGNLLCYPPGYRPESPSIMLTAHLDTVESTAHLNPVIDTTSIRSDGSTILGADNRLGLAVLVQMLSEVVTGRKPHRNFFVVFTVGEETGLHGAGTVNVSQLAPTGAYVFDCSKRPGVYIRESVGLHTFKAQFIGKAAHAGVAPEEGISAIQLACAGVTHLHLGRIDEGTTANVGRIRGGEALNAIPENATIEGEVRSFTGKRIAEELETIEHALRGAVNATGKLVFSHEADFEPYILAADHALIQHLEHAMRKVGLTPQPIRYTGGSDANKYNAKGFPAVNIGIGAQKPHSHEEFVLIEDVVKTYELAMALVMEPDSQRT